MKRCVLVLSLVAPVIERSSETSQRFKLNQDKIGLDFLLVFVQPRNSEDRCAKRLNEQF